MASTTTYNPNAETQTAAFDNAPQGTPITSDSLAPSTPINYQAAPTPQIFPIAGLSPDSAYQPTAPEQQATAVSTDIQNLNDQMVGKSAFTTEQQNKYGIPDLTQTQNDLTAQLKALNLQSQGLQNDYNNTIPNQEQQNVLGRGVTTGGLAPIQAGDLRKNQLQQASIASQALITSAHLNAVQGNLTTAQYMVDRAVSQKYDPIQEEINAKTANLDLILKSPAYSLADKNRASAQQQILNQQAAQIDIAKTNFTNTQNEILKYAQFATSAQLAALQKAKTPAEVAQIAASQNLQLPQTGRYKDSITTTTDAFGNTVQHVRIFDTLTGQFVSGAPGQTAASLNAQGSGGAGAGSYSGGSSTGTSTTKNGLSFAQYGSLANTNYNPNSTVDSLAQKYLDSYIKNGSVPTASTLGRSIKPQAMAQITSRASDLYFQATGQPLPNPEIIKGYQQQLIGNNKLLNNLNVQEGTIGKNAALLLQNLNANNINQNAQPLNNFIDGVKNMLGDPNVATFLAQNATVGNELGSLLSLKNAQGTTVHDKLEAAGIINKADNSAQIAAKVKILLQEAVNARAAIQGSNAELYKQTDPLLQDSNNPGRTIAQNQPVVEAALNKIGANYNDVVARTPPGTLPVLDKASGQVGYVTPQEFTDEKYIKL